MTNDHKPTDAEEHARITRVRLPEALVADVAINATAKALVYVVWICCVGKRIKAMFSTVFLYHSYIKKVTLRLG